jgi:hypothetical protein
MKGIVIVLVIVLTSLWISGCEEPNCDDAVFLTSVREFTFAFQLYDFETNETLIKNEDETFGIYNPDEVVFYNAEFEVITDPFTFDDGIVNYKIPTEVTPDNSITVSYIQFGPDQELRKFEINHEFINGECTGERLVQVNIETESFGTSLSVTSTTRVLV